MTYPNYLPTDRRYVHGEWPVSRHKFMSNAEQRVLHATAKTGQELRLTYANQTTEVVQEFLYHYDAMYGMQYAFELPDEVYTGWDGSKNLLGRKQLWQYKDVPRITSQKGLIATLQVTLVVATSQAIRCPDPAAATAAATRSITPRSTAYPSPNDPTKCFYLDSTKVYKSHWFKAGITHQYAPCNINCFEFVTQTTEETDADTYTAGPIPHRLEKTRSMDWEYDGNCQVGDTASFWRVLDNDGRNISPERATNSREIVSSGPSGSFCTSGPGGGPLDTGSDPILQYYIEIETGQKIYPVDCPDTGGGGGDGGGGDGGGGDGGGGDGGGGDGGGGGGGIGGDCPPVTPLPPLPPGEPPGDGEYEPNPGDGYPGDSPSGSGPSGPSGPTPSPSPGPGEALPPPSWPFPEIPVSYPPNFPSNSRPVVEIPAFNPPDFFYVRAEIDVTFKSWIYDNYLSVCYEDPGKQGPIYQNKLWTVTKTYSTGQIAPEWVQGWKIEIPEHARGGGWSKGCMVPRTGGKRPVYGPEGQYDCNFGFEPDPTYFTRRLETLTSLYYGPSSVKEDTCSRGGVWGSNNRITDQISGGGAFSNSIVKVVVRYLDNYGDPLGDETPWDDSANWPDDFDEPSPFSRSALIQPRNSSSSDRFPDYHPSSRTYELADWNTKRFPGAMTGQAITIPLSRQSVASDGKLNLTFANRADSVAEDILRHYHAFTGGFKHFKLSESILADWDSVFRASLKQADWIYDAPPQVTTSHPGTSTTSVRLVTTQKSGAKGGAGDPIGPPPGPGYCPIEPGPGGLDPLPTDPGNPGYPVNPPGGGGTGGPAVPQPKPPGPGTPTPTPEPEPFPWPYTVPEYPIDNPRYVPTTVRVTYHSWRSKSYDCQTDENVSDEVGSTITRETSGNIAGIRIARWDYAQRTYICDFGEDTIVYRPYFIIQKYVVDYINGGWKWSNLFDPAEGYDGISYTRDPIKWSLAKRDPGDLGWVSNVEIIKEGTPVDLPEYQNPFPDQTVPE